MNRAVVVGASLAGVSAVEGLRDRGFQGEILLVDAERHLPYDKPPLSKAALAGQLDEDRLPLRPEGWYEQHDVSLVLGERVVALDPAARVLSLREGRTVEFDGVVVASGSVARRLPVPCNEQEKIHVLRTLEDSRRLRRDLIPGNHLVVVGAGFVGLEVAATARTLGLEVTVVETARTPLSRVFGSEVGAWFRRLHEDKGVEVRCGVALDEITSGSDGFKLRFREGPALSADVVVAGVGAAPSTDWLVGSGLVVDNGVHCAPDLSAGPPGIVAAGDVVRWHNALFGEQMRIEHWTNAVEQGRHAAGTLLGESEPFVSVPYFWTDQFDAKVRFVGRAEGAQEIALAEPKANSLVALFGSNGVLRGALCVNLPRRLAQYRAAIADGMAWSDAVRDIDLHPTATATSSAGHPRPATTGGTSA